MSGVASRDEVVLVAAARTAFSRFGGVLKDTSSVDLAVTVVKEVLGRARLRPDQVDALYLGQTLHAEIANHLNVPARQVSLKAGFPASTLSLTVDRACCSSMTALQLAFKDIRSGEASVVVAAGVENLSRVPLLAPYRLRWGSGLGSVTLEDPVFEIGYDGWKPVALEAGEVALEYGLDREAQDRWALSSQQRYARAVAEGKFAEEIVPVVVPQKRGEPIVFEKDELPRPDTTLEALARLKTIYGSPTVTAGNAPGLDAGASALLMMSGPRAREMGLAPLGTVVGIGSAAVDPRFMACGPAEAIKVALRRVQLSVSDLELLEINEAFAAVTLVSIRVLSEGDTAREEDLRSRTNVNGGAVAIGHPVGASGARIVLTMICELRRRGGGYGAAAICGGLGQADAVIVRV
ncbi:MAG: thiolase family protein [Chloroflexota bacterium]